MYKTYGCKAQGEKLPWSFSQTLTAHSRKAAARDRNAILTTLSGEKPWSLAVTVTPDGRQIIQAIQSAVS